MACDAFLHRKGAPPPARANPKALHLVLLKPQDPKQAVLELVTDPNPNPNPNPQPQP